MAHLTPPPHTLRNWLRLSATVATLCATMLACAAGPADTTTATTNARRDAFVYSPYKHLNTGVDAKAPAAKTAVAGSPQVVFDAPRATLLPGANALTLAFAAGECGSEHWGPLAGQSVADANVAAFNRAGIPYIVSTGGEGNVFSCASDATMEQFVARYDTPMLLGLDFDIEAAQTPDMIRGLLQRIRTAQLRRPHLRLSFTLATLAASDAGEASLNAQGQQVMAAIAASQLEHYFINVMVMDFGPAKPANCVVRAGQCDMAASARQAVNNLHKRYGVPLSNIEVTAMIGINDVVENVFTTANAKELAQYAKQARLGGLHFWSLDRDTPCADGSTAVSPTCSSTNTQPALAYSRAFSEGLR